jgi:hypothetical protein
MKTSAICILFTFLCFYTFAQAPEGFNYQGIARDNKGKELANQSIRLRLSILQTSATGSSVYSETHTTTTNSFGLFNVKVGTGMPSVGNFSKINWTTGLYFLKVEFDPAGGTNFVFSGTSQLVSVPYAMMSNLSLKSLNDLDTSSQNELQIMKLQNDTLYLDKGGYVYLGKYFDKNEIQQLKTKLIADSIGVDLKINNESTVRINSDISLGLKIVSDSNYLKGLINANTTGLTNEINGRIAGDNAIKSKQITDSTFLRMMINSANINLATETNTRISADNNLKSKQISDSMYLKGLIATETNSRTTADNILQTGINNLRVKESSDSALFATYLTTTMNNLTTETTNRINGDNTLQGNLTTETNNRISGDNAIKSKIVSDSSYFKGQISNHVSQDHDTSANNEIQSLSISNDTIFLSKNGGNVKLPSSHYVGELYGGGVVFYVDRTGKHGLVCSMIDISATASIWWNNATNLIGINAQSYWNGQGNSDAIMTQSSISAAKLCDNYTNSNYGTGVYSDWYLPSKGELEFLWQNFSLVQKSLESDGNSATTAILISYYWSSTEFNGSYAWAYNLYDSFTWFKGYKDSSSFMVRAVRAY